MVCLHCEYGKVGNIPNVFLSPPPTSTIIYKRKIYKIEPKRQKKTLVLIKASL